MMVANWILFFVVVWNVTYIDKSMAQTTLSQYEGDTVTLPCSLSGTFTFPEWRGPPALTKYTNLGDASGTINPAAPAAAEGRLEYASNNWDLILSNAVIGDSGDYKCTFTGQGDHTITLTVNPATPVIYDCPGLHSDVNSKVKCVCAWVGIACAILLGLSITGIVLGCILKKCVNCCCNCFYNCTCSCCDNCVSKKCASCKCCNIKGLPSWYQILWFTVIGIPVAAGILLAWKCCAECCRKCCKEGNCNTSKNVVATGSNAKNAEIKLLENENQSKTPGKADEVKKEKPASGKQNQHDDQTQKVHHLEDEGKKPGRDLPPTPVGANHTSQKPNTHTTGHDRNNDDHPLVGKNIPTKKAGALESIPDSAGEEVKLKKKKKKRIVDTEEVDKSD